MFKDDWVYVGHMLDMGQQALNILRGKNRYLNVDEDIVWQVVQKDIPPLVAVLNEIIPPELK